MGETPYQLSGLEDASAAASYEENPDRLYNDRDPHYGLIREKPEHRAIIFYKAQGLSNREIAEKTGYTTVAISNTLRQPWARERLLEEIRKRAEGDPSSAILAGERLNNLFHFIEVRDNPEATIAERSAAARELLDRDLGKAIQKSEVVVARVNLADKEALDREEERLAAEEARLRLGKN
jgi:transposase